MRYATNQNKCKTLVSYTARYSAYTKRGALGASKVAKCVRRPTRSGMLLIFF